VTTHVRFQTKSDAIAERIEQDILNGVFLPGARLAQDELAARYGVSTTPVREALRRVSASGLAVLYPHRGHVVAGRSATEIDDILNVRIVVEGLLAARAARHITSRDVQRLRELEAEMRTGSHDDLAGYRQAHDLFHDTVYQAAGHTTLLEVSRTLRRTVLTTVLQYLDAGVSMDELHRQHHEIAEAARSRNPQQLKGLVREHVTNLRRLVVPYLQKLEAGEAPP
jgi:DNA-binding GntR family transcriptional regulator